MIHRAALAAVLAVVLAPPPGAQTCSGCHGPGGVGAIAATDAANLSAAMLAFRDGTREATIMDRIARAFTPGEIEALAQYWAAQK